MKRPLSLGVLIIPVLSAAAALALIVLALMPRPDTHESSPEAAVARETAVGGGKPARLDPAMPVPAPRP